MDQDAIALQLAERCKRNRIAAGLEPSEEEPAVEAKQFDFTVKITTFDGREHTVPLEGYEEDWQQRLPHIQRHCDALNCVAKRRGR